MAEATLEDRRGRRQDSEGEAKSFHGADRTGERLSPAYREQRRAKESAPRPAVPQGPVRFEVKATAPDVQPGLVTLTVPVATPPASLPFVISVVVSLSF